MSSRSVWGHAVMAGVATLAAVFAWQKPSLGQGDDAVVVVPGASDALTEIEWVETSHRVRVKKAAPDALSVEVTGLTGDTKSQAAKVFPGSQTAIDLMTKLAPLKAPRGLGPMAADRTEALGFDTPTGTLTLRFGERTAEVVVGGSTFGSGSQYILDEKKELYLVKATLLSGLRGGARALQERRLIPIDRARLARVNLATPTGGRELVHRRSKTTAAPFLSDPAAPDEKLEQATRWLERLTRLKVSDLVTQAPSTPPALTLEWLGDDGVLGTVALWTPENGVASATSSWFASPVTVPGVTVDSLLREVGDVLQEGR